MSDELLIFDTQNMYDNPMTQADFEEAGLDFDGAFDNWDEWRDFIVGLMHNYPNGVTWEIIDGKINIIGARKAVNSLIAKGLVEEFEDDDGNICYRPTNLGKEVKKAIEERDVDEL